MRKEEFKLKTMGIFHDPIGLKAYHEALMLERLNSKKWNNDRGSSVDTTIINGVETVNPPM